VSDAFCLSDGILVNDQPGARDTRFARRAARESDGLNGFKTQGSPRRLGQPWANFLDTFGVASMPRYARDSVDEL